ncbi:hypothetical protein BaRGS_00010638, partial [Batillaria attramentaria]
EVELTHCERASVELDWSTASNSVVGSDVGSQVKGCDCQLKPLKVQVWSVPAAVKHGCKIHHQNLGPATLAAEAVLITTSSLLLENRSQHSQEKSSVDLKNQVLKTAGYLDVVWRDEYLHWDPSHYVHVTDFLIPQSLVWLPDAVISNDVRGVFSLGSDRALVRVMHDGTVTWQPEFNTETGCKVDIYRYPFDTQACDIEMLPWMSTSQYQAMRYAGIQIAFAQTNSEFQLLRATVNPIQYPVTFSSDVLEACKFTVVLKRRSTFYLLSTVLPLAAFSLLTPLAMLVPADSGEKITLSVTVLLANLVFMGSLSDSVPRVGDSISLFVLYASLQILLSFAAVIVNVAALCISRMSTETGSDETQCPLPAPDSSSSTTGALYEMARCFLYVLRGGIKKPTHVHNSQGAISHGAAFESEDTVTHSSVNSISNGLALMHSGSEREKQSDGASKGIKTRTRDRRPAIARRDTLCFLGMLLVVIGVNVVTITILVS